MRFIHVMLSLVFLLVSVALVEACESPQKTTAGFKTAYPQGKVYALKGALAGRFLEVFNATPPKTAITGDAVLLTIAPRHRGVAHLHIFQAGCIKQRGRISRRLADKLFEMFDRGGREI